MKADVSINERIKDLRTERGLTQEQMADAVGIAYSTYGDYEQDDYFIPHTAVIALARYFGVTTDYLLGLTDNRSKMNTDLNELHLSDEAIDVICDDHTNKRLLSELISNPRFKQLLTDAEIYVDGYFDQNLQSYNAYVDFARKKLAEKNISGDNYSGVIEMIHVHQNDYFSHLIANDFLPILEDLKNAHKGDKETSDGGFTVEDYEKIAEAAQSSNGIKGLIAAITTALHIKKSPLKDTDQIITDDGLNEGVAAKLLGKSEIVEPNARKRRRNN